MKGSKKAKRRVTGRYGVIRRRDLWSLAGPEEMPELRVLSPTVREAFCRAMAAGQIIERRFVYSADDPLLIQGLSAGRYLQICKMCYLAATSQPLGRRSAARLYLGFADGRHGGLTDLPTRSAQAFREWFVSNRWQGCHPWEIWREHVFLSVHQSYLRQIPMSFWLMLRSLHGGVLPTIAAMAVALRKAAIPFAMPDSQLYAKFVAGDDFLGVAEDRVWEFGSPIWPKGAGILTTLNSEKVVSELESIPGAIGRVRWFPGRQVPVLSFNYAL